MALSVLLTKRRSSHLMGVAARGTFEVSGNNVFDSEGKDRGFPAHDFFEAGKTFEVQARFANLTEFDDAALDVRGCAIKFSEQRHESPLDLLMNTGTYSPAFNLVTFAGFVVSKFFPSAVSRAVVRSNRPAREGGIAGLRRAPDSYTNLHYYGQIVRHWVDLNGTRHLVRYRCQPLDPTRESGLPSPEDASHIWQRERLSDEDRPTNYLRNEFVKRVNEGQLEMRLEVQFHTPEAGDTDEWYNASIDWDERECPWIALGKLTLDQALSDVDTELLQMDPSNHPMTLGIPGSTGPLDYRSMGDSEARVVRALQRFRVWMFDTYGPPSFDGVETATEPQQ
jgi:arachidonate 5-lipoxygenase